MRVLGLVVLLVVAGCTAPSEDPRGEAPRAIGATELASGLERFSACDALGDDLRHALTMVHAPVAIPDIAAEADGGPAAVAAPRAGAGADSAAPRVADEAFSTTNVQERGVDEPDLVKTDGRSLFVLSDGRLRIIDVRAGAPRLLSGLAFSGGYASELLLSRDRLLVIGTTDRPPVRLPEPVPLPEPLPEPRPEPVPLPEPAPAPDGTLAPGLVLPRAQLWLVDVSDPSSPSISSTLTLDGWLITGRMSDGIARLVLHSGVQPLSLGPAGEDRGEARARIEAATVSDLLPTFEVRDSAGERRGQLVACEQVYRPVDLADPGMVTVLSLDPGSSTLDPVESQAVLGGAENLYATADSLYVTTTRWTAPDPGEPLAETGTSRPRLPPGPERVTTEMHRFDLSDPGQARYRSSGSVPGRLLNQWSMSEHEGYLRVATTEDGFAPEGSVSAVRVLAERGDRLEEVGMVGDLGRGERIQAVRYAGDTGYVVTFRQTDPLYTLDLSDPAQPRVLGELKILGYSAYLHPIGENHLLGVGQDADEQGRVRGVQLSLFDVSDLANPTRVDQATLGQGMSDVEYDHRAFLYWELARLAVVPVQSWERDPFAGAVGFTVDVRQGISQRGVIEHDGVITGGFTQPIRRSLVVGDTLFTVSAAGIKASDVATLSPIGWLGF